MLPKDRKLIQKLKRRISILVIITLLLSYWISQNYKTIEFVNLEKEELEYQLSEKDKTIESLKLSKKISKEPIKILEVPKKQIKIKEIKKEQKPVIVIQKEDTNKTIVEEQKPVITDSIN